MGEALTHARHCMSPDDNTPPDFVDDDPSDAVPTRDKHAEAFDFEPEFNGQPLLAFTEDRQCLAELLSSNLIPEGDGKNPTAAYMPRVWAVLWLCMHEPQEWRHLRGNPGLWWETIEAWAMKHCPRALWPEAIHLVYGRKADGATGEPEQMGLWEAARANMVRIKRKPGASPGKALRQ